MMMMMMLLFEVVVMEFGRWRLFRDDEGLMMVMKIGGIVAREWWRVGST